MIGSKIYCRGLNLLLCNPVERLQRDLAKHCLSLCRHLENIIINDYAKEAAG
jgi:hypothetical protein